MSKYLTVRSGYMRRAHSPREVVRVARLLLGAHPEPLEFDTVVGTGLSGALVVPALARSLRKRCLVVRKSGESSHGYYPVEGELGRRWLFVDDLSESGATLRNCASAIDKVCSDFRHSTELVGMFLYGDGDRVGDGTGSLRSSQVLGCDPRTGWVVSHSNLITREWEVNCQGCRFGCAGCRIEESPNVA